MQTLPNILQAIGRTPMVRLARISPPGGATLFGKCDFLNPGGSAKDRLAMRLIENAERAGELQPGGTVVEASSGNTAIALAQICAVKGYKCVIVAAEAMSEEKRRIVRAFGAELFCPEENGDPTVYRSIAARIARDTPRAVFVDQFAGSASNDVHYDTTAEEILAQLGRVDAFVAGVGTGGTLVGVARRLKEADAATYVVCAEPVGGILIGPPSPHMIEGIGVNFPLPELDRSVIDEVIPVTEAEAFGWARRLAREEGILVGGSSGAAVAAAYRVAEQLQPEARVVAMLADTGRNYLSKMFDDEWLTDRTAGALGNDGAVDVAVARAKS